MTERTIEDLEFDIACALLGYDEDMRRAVRDHEALVDRARELLLTRNELMAERDAGVRDTLERRRTRSRRPPAPRLFPDLLVLTVRRRPQLLCITPDTRRLLTRKTPRKRLSSSSRDRKF